MKRSRPPLWLLILAIPAGVAVVAVAVFAALAMQPRPNPSGQGSTDSNERCAPSPCGAPNGFEVDVTNVATDSGQLVLTVTFRNHTTPQLFEAVSYRHTSPADFTLQVHAAQTLKPVFNDRCADWPELDVPRGATSPPRTLCFAAPAARGATLVWDPDLGVIPRPVSIALG